MSFSKCLFNGFNKFVCVRGAPNKFLKIVQTGHRRADHSTSCRQILIEFERAGAIPNRTLLERNQADIDPLQISRQLSIGTCTYQVAV